MIFAYRCDHGHTIERMFKIGQAAEVVLCDVRIPGYVPGTFVDCGRAAVRDFAAEVETKTLGVVDPFRSFHLSTKKDSEAQRQQREIGGPTDTFERRRIEKERGVTFVGNDTSGMSDKARRGIEKWKDKVSCGEVKP